MRWIIYYVDGEEDEVDESNKSDNVEEEDVEDEDKRWN